MTFNYDDEKDFELRAKDKQDRDEWVEAIEFLIDIRDKLGNLADGRSVSVSTYFSVDSCVLDKEDSASPTKPKVLIFRSNPNLSC